MDSNTYSIRQTASSSAEPAPRPASRPDRLAALAAAADELAAQDLDRLTDAALAEEVLGLRRLVDGLEGQWLRRLAAVDARGAAGADQDQETGSTAAWLRNRLRMGPGAAASSVRTARALFRGPLAATAQALTAGTISPAHAAVLAHGTQHLPNHTTIDAEPVLVEAASRLDPPRLRPGPRASPAGGRPRRRRRPGPAAARSPWGVAVADLGRPGRHRRAAGARSRPHPARRPRTPSPPTTPALVASGPLMP